MLLFAVKRYKRNKQQQNQFNPSIKINTAYAEQQTNIEVAEAFLQKMNDVRMFIDVDLLACDAKLSLFVAAVMSYRFEKLLRPCPQNYMKKGNKEVDIAQLYDVIGEMPKLKTVLRSIVTHSYEQFQLRSMHLLHWILVLTRDPCLRTLGHDELKHFCNCICPTPPRQQPTHIFEVISYEYNERVQDFCALRNKFATQIAFYGGRLEQFYSLLMDRSLEDMPLLLATDLNVAIKRSPVGAGWGASACGGLIKCIAVCEILKKPESIYITSDSANEYNHDIVVLDSKYMRVSHLIFYSQSSERHWLSQQVNSISVIEHWLKEHESFVSLLTYWSLVGITCLIFQVAHRKS